MHTKQSRVVKIFGLRKSPSLTKNWQWMCWLAVSLLALLVGLLLQTFDFDNIRASLNSLHAQLAQHPHLLMLALAILPGHWIPYQSIVNCIWYEFNATVWTANDLPAGRHDAKHLHHLVLCDSGRPLKKLPHSMAASALHTTIASDQGCYNSHPVDTTRARVSLCATKHNLRTDRRPTKNVLTDLHSDHGDDK